MREPAKLNCKDVDTGRHEVSGPSLQPIYRIEYRKHTRLDLRELRSDPDLAVNSLCDLTQVTQSLWALDSLALNSTFILKNAISSSCLHSANVYFLEIFFNETRKYSLFSNVVLLGASINEKHLLLFHSFDRDSKYL